MDTRLDDFWTDNLDLLFIIEGLVILFVGFTLMFLLCWFLIRLFGSKEKKDNGYIGK